MDKILDAHDKAHEEGYKDALERVRNLVIKLGIIPQNGKGEPINAYVNYGRWLARCECGGVEYVAEGVDFMCLSCGNRENGNKYRPVIFPKNKKEIETELLRRPVKLTRGIKPSQLAALSKPKHGRASRSWNVGESVNELKNQLKREKAVK